MTKAHYLVAISALIGVIGTLPDLGSRRVLGVAPPQVLRLKSIGVIPAHQGHVSGLAFSPDASTLASAGDMKVVLWDLRTGRRLREKAWNSATSIHLAFVNGGKNLACAAGERKRIHLLDTQTFQVRLIITPPNELFDELAATPDGKMLAALSARTLLLYRMPEGKELAQFTIANTKKFLNAVAIRPDGKQVAVGLDHKSSVRILQSSNCRSIYDLSDEQMPWGHRVTSLVFHPYDSIIAAGYANAAVLRRWNSQTGDAVESWRWIRDSSTGPGGSNGQKFGGSSSVVLSPDGTTLFVACDDRVLRLIEWASGGVRLEMPWDGGPIAVSSDGKLLAGLNSFTGRIHLWDLHAFGVPAPDLSDVGRRDQLWSDLRGRDTRAAFRAVASLSAAREQAVPLLRQHLRRSEPINRVAVQRLVTKLDDEDFSMRQLAMKELAELGRVAETELRAVLTKKPSLEVQSRIVELLKSIKKRSHEAVPAIRTVEVLERIGTADARHLLEFLAAGADSLPETRSARRALERTATFKSR